MTLSDRVWVLLQKTLAQYLEDPSPLAELANQLKEELGTARTEQLDSLLEQRSVSYRHGVLLQLSFALEDPQIDTTKRAVGARGVARKLGTFLGSRHVQSVADAYQNIAKNSTDLVRGNVPEWDRFIQWANTASQEQRLLCFQYACCKVASTARPVDPMPELDIARLTFARVMALYETLLATPSGGAHEQFIVASLLESFVRQTAPDQYVDTKRISASDKSSRAAGDVQIKTGSRLLEAYEVTAAGWETKLTPAAKTIRGHDLSRMHVIAPLGDAPYRTVLERLLETQDDVSVIDLRAFCSVTLSSLRRQERGAALRRLYELLERYQESVERVNAYVAALSDAGLALAVGESGGEGVAE